ncbi:MFS transporter [Altererythrobacter salegens]|uniref:MFS transporter n=1 Tax=Croceibacterium salegens TaxID=1737568 RepID=A0A6I4T1J5_9SPHN|nr:MFS transporter [Croceibacterium salegens]MXO61190.1 MFS transporter [Croceibacterium salegens]
MAEPAAGSMILSENKILRIFSFFLFYLGQGLPLGVSQVALPAWLVMNGAEESAVAAIIATAFLPWSFKFIPAALMDRYAYLAMGRRRLWLICAQMLMVIGFAIAAIVAPGPDNLEVILSIVILIGTGSAIQDVAVDGMAVDILSDEEQGTASAFMFGGQTVGRALSGAIAGFSLQHYGSATTFWIFLPIILLITLYVVVIRERPGEKRFPWSEGAASPVNLERHVGAWWPMARAAFKSLIKFDSLKLVTGSVAARMGSGMFSPMWPIIGGIGFVGFTTAGYSSMVSSVDLVMAVVSIGVGSFLTLRLGARVASSLVYSTYFLLAIFVLYGQAYWSAMTPFIIMSCVWSMHDTLTSICTNPLRMQLSDPTVAATQFTIYNSLSNLPVTFGATLFAVLGGTKELGTVMWTSGGLMLLGALIFSTLKAGSRHEAAEPVPEFN